MEIIVFTSNGCNFIFKNCENFEYTTQGFRFTYTGVSTGKTRKIEFNWTSTSGYAICD